MIVAVDAYGGDNAPLEIIKGCAQAVKELNVKILLVGKENELTKIIADNNISRAGIDIMHAEGILTMEDEPTSIIKDKKDSSMAAAFYALKESKADAFVSAGNSGAILVGATMIVRRIRSIKRAALAVIMPSQGGPCMLCDCGANVECKPEYLEQFALMGSIYMKQILKIDNPRIGLLNNGAESHKGLPLQVEAYKLLSENKSLNFIGNIEGRDLPFGKSDVVVTDGFTGNITLKLYEGLGKMFSNSIKGIFKQSLVTKLGAVFVLKGLNNFKKTMDYTEYGGAPLLGICKPVIKAHGSSNAKAIKNAIRQAVEFSTSKMIESIEKNINSKN